MQTSAIAKILGILLMMFSLSMLPPIAIGLWYQDGATDPFWIAFAVTLLTGFFCWWPVRHNQQALKVRDGFLIVVLFWTVLSLFGALPFAITEFPKFSLTDAIFDSVSGLTTTGAEVFSGLDLMPHAIRFYHQQLQFLGGMGIVVLAVAILPMLGVGGMQLYRAETPGPVKDAKLTPRLTQTAKHLWGIYIGLTVLCALGFWISGMTLFDAVGESFGIISTGGFTMHDASFAFYQNHIIDYVAVVFMILGGTNFSLHFLFLHSRKLSGYWRDVEFKTYIALMAIVTLIVGATLMFYHTYDHFGTTWTKTILNVTSLMSTTGITDGTFANWPTFTPMLIMIGALIGGCAASTSGGIKVIRFLLLQKQGVRELKRLVHPRAILTIKFNGKILPESVAQSIWAFVSVFIALFVLLLLLMLATGLDLTTAFGALAACISNAGAGIGNVAHSFEGLDTVNKWILIFAMLAGRLEIFSLLVLFSPSFWRR